ncbi:MAG TPA: PA2779 family protein [Terracidiphilus sp.]|jgi:hypothetical protein|nr:PA2779 family protein [Terracidiphilus sp.]
MFCERYPVVRALTASALVAVFSTPQSLVAQVADHLVSPSTLQKAAVGASQQREQNMATLKTFFSSDKARHALESSHMSPEQVNKAISSLSDDELAQLAQRANKAQADFAAGSISDRDLLIILVCVAALILIIIAVR